MIGRFATVAVLAFALTGCVAIGATSGRVSVQGETARPVAPELGISDRDLQTIREYCRTNRKAAVDLSKRGGKLPPGMAKRDKLPAGVGEALPGGLDARLSPVPAGHVRVHVGPDVLLLESKTRLVADILYGVIN